MSVLIASDLGGSTEARVLCRGVKDTVLVQESAALVTERFTPLLLLLLTAFNSHRSPVPSAAKLRADKTAQKVLMGSLNPMSPSLGVGALTPAPPPNHHKTPSEPLCSLSSRFQPAASLPCSLQKTALCGQWTDLPWCSEISVSQPDLCVGRCTPPLWGEPQQSWGISGKVD